MTKSVAQLDRYVIDWQVIIRFGKYCDDYDLDFCAAAYKHGDGKKIDGRRVLVDVERGRTVKGWLPRRLGKLNQFHNYILDSTM